jgi:hypothetical protein
MNAEDYTWFAKTHLYEAYCLTLVRGLGRSDALARIDAEPTGSVFGLMNFINYAYDNASWRTGSPFPIGAVELDGWTLLVEANGFLGVTAAVIRPLSAGTRVVSHYRNVDAEDRFCWMDDGELRLQFEPLFPYIREGSEPDSLIDVMRQVGFDLRNIEDHDYELHTEAAFALAEHLTGVRLTYELLDTADYLCGLAALKP